MIIRMASLPDALVGATPPCRTGADKRDTTGYLLDVSIRQVDRTIKQPTTDPAD
jgi:hypothetical protein